MRMAALLAARVRSERLPGKALLPLAGRPVLAHVVDRLRACDRVSRVVVVTSPRAEDDAIAAVAGSLDVPCHRSGASERGDVVALLDEALRRHAPDAELVYRALCDCPLFSVELLSWFHDVLARTGADVCWVGAAEDDWPIYGARESPWSRDAWDQCALHSAGDQREHAGLWIYQNLRRFRVHHVTWPRDEYYRPYRLELDTEADYRVLSAVHDALYPTSGSVTMLDAIRWLDAHPEVAALNAEVPLKSLTTPDWRLRRGQVWACQECGSTLLRASATGRDRAGARLHLETRCERCGTVRKFYEVPPFFRHRRPVPTKE